MTKKILCVLLDGMRADYINAEDSPFLFEMLSSSLFVPQLKKSAPFCERSEVYSGKPALTTRNYAAFVMDPDSSPYSSLSSIGFLTGLVDFLSFGLPSKIGGKFGTFLYRGMKKIRRWLIEDGFSSDEGAYEINDIPLRMLPYFRLGEDTDFHHKNARLFRDSMFAKWSNAGIKYVNYFDDLQVKGLSGTRDQRLKAVIASFAEDFDVFLFADSEIDAIGHVCGTSRQVRSEVVARTDAKVSNLHSKFKEVHEHGTVIYFSPHGMRDVETLFDAESELLGFIRQKKMRIPEDVIYFLDSTMVRVWGSRSEEFLELFQEAQWRNNGVIVDDRVRQEEGFPAELDEKIWLAHPGVCVFPDFFRRVVPPRGMHGYTNSDPQMAGFAIVNGPEFSAGIEERMELVSLHSLLVSGQF